MAWQALVSCALLGTERQAPPALAGDDALGRLLGQLDGTDREGDLLRAAGVVALWQRAGQELLDDRQPCPPASAADSVPVCGVRAARHLERLLQGQNVELLPEWLEQLAAVGRRVPAALLPALLDVGARQMDVQPLLPAVLGERGDWLARQREEWRYAVRVRDEAQWSSDSQAERLALLQYLRTVDPARGRELLASTWDTELARQRRAFLAVLAIGLSLEDEPWLETVLDERSAETRAAAAALLARLPDAALVHRLRERALNVLRGTLAAGRLVLEVEPPEDEPALRRDGVTGAALPGAAVRLGEKAWRLCQMLAAVPPATWCQHWQQSPAAILVAAQASEWCDALREGWLRATLCQGDADWAEALLSLYPDHASHTAALAALLPAARFEQLLMGLLAEDPERALLILGQAQRPWSVDLGRAVLSHLRQRAAEDKSLESWASSALRGFARWLPPQLHDEVAAGWPVEARHWPRWETALNTCLERLRLRRVMAEALRAGS